MRTYLPAATRGLTKIDWLTSHHAFAFNSFRDPDRTHFGPLRVLNDDVIAPASGFGAHPHDNMEIVTYVLAGALEHRDSTGGHGVIRAGEVQHMAAGRGVVHAEYNNSPDTPVRLLQVWIFPRRYDLDPGYAQKFFEAAARRNRLLAVASGAGADGALPIHQDATMYVAALDAGASLAHDLHAGEGAYCYVIDGALSINTMALESGDAAQIVEEPHLDIRASAPTELVLFALPMQDWEPE